MTAPLPATVCPTCLAAYCEPGQPVCDACRPAHDNAHPRKENRPGAKNRSAPAAAPCVKAYAAQCPPKPNTTPSRASPASRPESRLSNQRP